MAEPFHWEIIDNPGKRGVVSLSSYWQILRMQSQAEFLTKGSLFVKREFGSPPPLFWAILRSIFFSFSESLYQEPYLCSVTCKQTLEQWKPPSAGYWFWWNKSWLSRMVAFFFFFLTGGVPDLSLFPSLHENELDPHKSTENPSQKEDLRWETLAGRQLSGRLSRSSSLCY